jgi:hypothetical protein
MVIIIIVTIKMTTVMIAMVMHRYTWFLESKYMWSGIPKSGMERDRNLMRNVEYPHRKCDV